MNETAKQSEIATAYDDWAETYDSDLNRTRDLAAKVLRQAGHELAGRKVIEVGCGTGRNTTWLAEQAAEIIALDFSKQMLAKARERVLDQRVRFVQHDVLATWPLDDSSADVIVAMLILEHVKQLEVFFAEAVRVLHQDGRLFICELHPTRQYAGGQAQFNNKKTGERQRVTAFLHEVSDYVNAALNAGFELERLGEWRDGDAEVGATPRLLSLHFRLRENQL
jgi:ubiquinone/menaquinone biosynthesis C-methylase UbiE